MPIKTETTDKISNTKAKNAAIAARSAALPKIPKQILDQLVPGPMSPAEFNDLSTALKKAPVERVLGAELTHHLATRAAKGQDLVPGPGTRRTRYLQSSLAPQLVHCRVAKLRNMANAEAPTGGAKGSPHLLHLTCFIRQLQKRTLAKKRATKPAWTYKLTIAIGKLEAKNNTSDARYLLRGVMATPLKAPGFCQTSFRTPHACSRRLYPNT